MIRFSGSIVAIVTPMNDDGSLDIAGLKRLIDWHVAEGTDGIVIVGTTGESPTVDHDEHRLLIRTTVEQVARRVPVIAASSRYPVKQARERKLWTWRPCWPSSPPTPRGSSSAPPSPTSIRAPPPTWPCAPRPSIPWLAAGAWCCARIRRPANAHGS